MNRRQKIIISVTGIFLVLLLLVGLTYGYFLTKISGNTNAKSISVSTANLQLVYGNDDGNVIGDGELIVPNTTFDAKTFTVTNKGNADTDYVVVIDNATNNFKYNDFVYTLSCTSDGEPCTGVDTETTYPINGGVLVANTIEVGKTHTYSFTLKYVDTGSDQSDDMNKTLTGRINIKDISGENPYSSNTSLLSYNIINNAILEKNGTTLTNLPLTTPAVKTSSFAYKTDDATEASSESSESISTTYQGYYWTYGTGYTVDESTGKFTLTGVSTCKYNDGSCNATLVGKYIVNTSASSNSNSTDTQKTTTNLSNIYKVTTAPASSTSTITMKVKKLSSISYSTEKELSVTTDDYGTSYYYRGGVTDNYVNFAGMCWRIVRIEGDGSTKLILEDYNTTCNSSSFTGNWSDGNTYTFGSLEASNFIGGSLATAFKTFQTSKLVTDTVDYTSKLKIEKWCFDDTVTKTFSYGLDDNYNTVYTESEATRWYTDKYYGAYTRIITNKKPSLNCTGTKLTKYKDGTDMYVATLTADEISFAGASSSVNYNYYLMNDYAKNNLYWWALSPYYHFGNGSDDSAFYLYFSECLSNIYVFANNSARPAVTLSSGAQITSGDGTKNNPYTIK